MRTARASRIFAWSASCYCVFVPGWLIAAGWGLMAGSALLLGAGFGYFVPFRQRTVASVMAVGAGVLMSALSFELMEVAARRGGLVSTSFGFIAGALLYSLANAALSLHGAKHRKRSREQQPSEHEDQGSGLAIALGALLDGIPESIVIGLSLLAGKGVSVVAAAAVFLSNLPEGLSSASGMKRAGRSWHYVFGVWGRIALLCGAASLLGYVAFDGASAFTIAAVTATAAASNALAERSATTFAMPRDGKETTIEFCDITAFACVKLQNIRSVAADTRTLEASTVAVASTLVLQ